MSDESIKQLQEDISSETDNNHNESSSRSRAPVALVESRAVSIYEGPKAFIPTSIKWLDPNFDLKVPPENWMRGSSPIEKYILKALHNRRTKKATHMSSIAMAHSNVNLVDSIDVISDAKNIKRLLEIPFAKEEPLSLMIHRVGKTLLIDEFDIHKHLLKKQQDDWKWMRDFYHDQVTSQVSPFPPRVQQTQERLTERNMFSKLLYYSILADQQDGESLSPDLVASHLPESGDKSEQQTSDLHVPDEEEMYFSDDSELGDESDFTQQMEWKFEDIKMMIGTDLPIFSEGSSCVSLRLRDANSPITVLTGLNYWLDNLMCNVPEIAMCYHLNGFVQRYEKLSTAEIPHLEGSKFKPEFVKDVAQNILSFLRSKATKIGHTYWLYKEKKGDIVKLYDLTSLCDEEQSRQNPFRHPLAHLLFKVALKMHKEDDHSKSGIIRALLTNCLALAPEAQPQIAVTAYRILCQLYTREDDSDVPNDLTQHHVDDEEDDNSKVVEDKLIDETCTRLDLASLSESRTEANDNKTNHFPPVGGTAEIRCEEALRGLAEGLRLVDDDIDRMVSKVEDGEPLTSVPSVAIPLSYQPLTKEVNSVSGDAAECTARPFKDRLRWVSRSWHRQSKADMLSKVMYCCYTLARSKDGHEEYGKALKFIKIALLSFDTLTLLDKDLANSRSELCYHSVKLCGDVQIKMQDETSMDIYCKNYKDYTKHEEAILNSALKDVCSESFARLYTLSTNSEQRLLNSLLCYWQCHSQAPQQQLGVVLQRLGNCCNELGQFYTRKAKALMMDGTGNSKEANDNYTESLLAEADKHMRDALNHFTSISDKTNMALVNVNLAKTLRLRHIHLSGNSNVYTTQGQALYRQVIEHYSEAQRILGRKENCAEVWNLVVYEQMECMLEQSFLLEDKAVQGMTTDEVDKQLTSLLIKLLKFYESAGQLRKTAAVHHRMGLRLNKSYRECPDLQSQNAKRLHNMAESHYDKAVNILSQFESGSQEVVRIIVDKLDLCQTVVNSCASPQAKRKHLESGLSMAVRDLTITALSNFSSNGQLTSSDEGMLLALLQNLTHKVQFITLSLMRLSAHPPSGHRRSKREEIPSDRYKAMYRTSLNVDTKETSCDKLRESVTRMCTALAEYQH